MCRLSSELTIPLALKSMPLTFCPYQQVSFCGPVDIFNQRNSKKSNIERA